MVLKLPEDISKIDIVFLDGTPDGPRQVSNDNWKGECIVCSRSKIEDDPDRFKVSGVYILVGTDSEAINRKRIYVGQGDIVLKRLKSHLQDQDKAFWETAIVFSRSSALHSGQIKYLEARLIELANEARRVSANETGSNYATLSSADKAEMEKFLSIIVFNLIALGFDFFRRQQLPAEQDVEAEAVSAGPEDVVQVPTHLQKLTEQFRDIVSHFSNVECYTTRTPDYRAKVTNGSHFRVFARMKFKKAGVKLELKDVKDFKIGQDDRLDEEVASCTEKAYRLAVNYLRPGKKANAESN
jgi:hypothetical protein